MAGLRETSAGAGDYDVLVLGGGSAGSAAAREAVLSGSDILGRPARVVMINDGPLGGLCILHGCMPTKALLASAEHLRHAREAAEFGIHVPPPSFDYAAIQERKRRLVERFQRAKIDAIEQGGYEVLTGRAEIAAPGVARFGSRRLSAGAIIVATGSRASMPPIKGIDGVPVIDSDQALELDAPPASLMVQGAGAVALEMATFFAALGTEVTLVNRSPILRRGEDPRMSACYARALKSSGITVHAPARTLELEPADGGLVAHIEQDGRKFDVYAESFLAATGRAALLDGLGLENGGVRVEHGAPLLDANLRAPGTPLFFAGDATGERLLLHVATRQGRHAARNALRFLAGAEQEPYEERVPVTALFTEPPYAEAGLTFAQARAKGHDAIRAWKDWGNQGRGIVMGARPGEGFLQLVADRPSGLLLGAQILGPRADDLIHVVCACLHHEGRIADLLAMPWYHPTLSEAFLEVARDLEEKRASENKP